MKQKKQNGKKKRKRRKEKKKRKKEIHFLFSNFSFCSASPESIPALIALHHVAHDLPEAIGFVVATIHEDDRNQLLSISFNFMKALDDFIATFKKDPAQVFFFVISFFLCFVFFL